MCVSVCVCVYIYIEEYIVSNTHTQTYRHVQKSI